MWTALVIIALIVVLFFVFGGKLEVAKPGFYNITVVLGKITNISTSGFLFSLANLVKVEKLKQEPITNTVTFRGNHKDGTDFEVTYLTTTQLPSEIRDLNKYLQKFGVTQLEDAEELFDEFNAIVQKRSIAVGNSINGLVDNLPSAIAANFPEVPVELYGIKFMAKPKNHTFGKKTEDAINKLLRQKLQVAEYNLLRKSGATKEDIALIIKAKETGSRTFLADPKVLKLFNAIGGIIEKLIK